MTPEQGTALVVAITGLLGAIGLLIGQLVALRRDINGKMEELVRHASAAAEKRGELAGRDYQAQRRRRTDVPLTDSED